MDYTGQFVDIFQSDFVDVLGLGSALRLKQAYFE
jgi:hypothetical protein